MILLDATAMVAFVAGESAAGRVDEILRGGDAGLLSVNLAETLDILVRVRGLDQDAVEDRMVPLIATVLPVVSVGEAEARSAARVRADRYHRTDRPLSLADCLLIGTALVRGASVASSDVPVLATAGDLGVPTHTLPRD